MEKLETIPAWDLEKIKSKKAVVFLEAKRDRKIHIAALMDISHLKKMWRTRIAEMQRQSRAPGDTVKDDSGAYAVLSEQRSSASLMTAKKVNVIARLPGCDGQAADAVSAQTQVRMEDAHRSLF